MQLIREGKLSLGAFGIKLAQATATKRETHHDKLLTEDIFIKVKSNQNRTKLTDEKITVL